MTEAAIPREYRIVLRHKAGSDGDFTPPQFTVIVEATSPDDAISKAEGLSDLLQDKFVVVEVRPSEFRLADRNGRG